MDATASLERHEELSALLGDDFADVVDVTICRAVFCESRAGRAETAELAEYHHRTAIRLWSKVATEAGLQAPSPARKMAG